MSPRRIGIMLKTIREDKGLTQTVLAKKAKVSQPYIAKLEAGAKANPSLTALRRIAKALGVPITKLLG